MNNQNVVGWFEIYVENMERAKVFYSNVFNMASLWTYLMK